MGGHAWTTIWRKSISGGWLRRSTIQRLQSLLLRRSLLTRSPRDVCGGYSRLLQNATDIAYNDDPFITVNMSVWESLAALGDFAYR
jgi:hypothetical protein